MRIQDLDLTLAGNGVAVAYHDTPMVVELGSGIPLHNRWRWSFDGSLRLVASAEEQGKDSLGDYAALVLTYADEEGPLVQQRLQAYAHGSYLLAETTARSRLEAAGRTGLTPLVGREHEIALLRERWAQVRTASGRWCCSAAKRALVNRAWYRCYRTRWPPSRRRGSRRASVYRTTSTRPCIP